MSTSDNPLLGAPGERESLGGHFGAAHSGPLVTAASQTHPRSLGTESPGHGGNPAALHVRDAAPAGAQPADPARNPVSTEKPVSAEWNRIGAVEAIYHTHYRSLVRTAALLVRDVATAEDVVQDSFIAMHSAWWRLRDSDKALSYLRQSVVNRSRSVLRHRVVVDRHAPKAPPDMPSAEHGALSLLERSAVISALHTLPPRQREALVLKYYADLSEAQIATTMGISKGAVKSHTARGTASLRSILAKDG